MSEKSGHVLVIFIKQCLHEIHYFFVYPLLVVSYFRTCYKSILLVLLINTYYNELNFIKRLPSNSICQLYVKFNCGLLKTLR